MLTRLKSKKAATIIKDQPNGPEKAGMQKAKAGNTNTPVICGDLEDFSNSQLVSVTSTEIVSY